jgi:pimeloyl-ACP methyl ester carboxylesterase
LLLIASGCATEQENLATSADGVTISFDVVGEGDPALIFVHGWTNNKSIWDAQADHFSDRYKVVTIDLLGFGESGNNRQNWSIKAYAGDVAAVIDRLELGQVIVVGFSLGAPIAVETASVIPETVKGVVLVDGLHDVEVTFPPPVFAFMDSVMMDLVLNPTMEKMVGGGFIKKDPEATYARVLAMLEGGPTTGWRESLHGYMEWHNEGKISTLERLQTPILAINNDAQPTNEEAFQKYVPSFHARIIADVGHVVMWDATDEFNQLLEESILELGGTGGAP